MSKYKDEQKPNKTAFQIAFEKAQLEKTRKTLKKIKPRNEDLPISIVVKESLKYINKDK